MQTGHHKVLIVDDEPDLLEVTQYILEEHGFLIDIAPSGNKALNKLGEGQFDAIISDIRMPDGDGVYLLEQMNLKQIKTPIIFLSGFADVTSQQLKAMGAIDLYAKPIDFEKLVNTVKQMVEKKN